MALGYQSIKFIRVNNTWLAIIYYCLIGFILAYVVGYTIIYAKSYQEYDALVGSTGLKVKGAGFLTDPKTGKETFYDTTDLVVPPVMPDALFITTNFVRTEGQARSKTCPGNAEEGLCDCKDTPGDVAACCKVGSVSKNGIYTGRCGADGLYCELNAWCPLEASPEDLSLNVIPQVADFTVFARTNVRFPKFEVSRSVTGDKIEMGKNLFYVRDILNNTGFSYSDVSTTGAVLVVTMSYDCDLNKDIDECNPTFGWMRLDDYRPTSISPGFNYRYGVNYYDANGNAKRDLIKAYGVYIMFQVFGRAGRFSIVPLMISLGSGLALLGVATLICDLIMQYLLPRKNKYVGAKYQEVADEEEVPLTEETKEV